MEVNSEKPTYDIISDREKIKTKYALFFGRDENKHLLLEIENRFLWKVNSINNWLNYTPKTEPNIKKLKASHFITFACVGVTPKRVGFTFKNKLFEEELDKMADKSNPKNTFISFSLLLQDTNHSYSDYYAKLIETVKLSNSSIVIYDYFANDLNLILPKNQFDLSTKEYLEGLEEYYLGIESVLKNNKNIQYTRFLSLPQNFQGKNEDALDQVIPLLYQKTWAHLIRCFTFFPNQFKVQIITIPIRMYSFMIIDESYLISEYFRIRKSGIAIPDSLFIENIEQNDHSYDLSKVYQKELYRRIEDSRKCILVNRFNLQLSIMNLIKTYKQKKELLREEKNTLERELNGLRTLFDDQDLGVEIKKLQANEKINSKMTQEANLILNNLKRKQVYLDSIFSEYLDTH